MPRAASLAMALDEASLRQLERWRYRLDVVSPYHARQRLPGGEAAVDFGELELVTGVASSHALTKAQYGY